MDFIKGKSIENIIGYKKMKKLKKIIDMKTLFKL